MDASIGTLKWDTDWFQSVNADANARFQCILTQNISCEIYQRLSCFQPNRGSLDVQIRLSQAKEVEDLLKQQNIPQTEPVFICGDFNIEFNQQVSEARISRYVSGQAQYEFLKSLNQHLISLG